MTWLFYHLAANPGPQEKLHKEVSAYLGGRNLAPGDLTKLPYLKACIKESSRSDPVAIGFGRKTRWMWR